MDDVTIAGGADRVAGAKHRTIAHTALRSVVALALLATGGLLWLHPLGYRDWEAWSAGHLIQAFGGGDVLINRMHAGFYVGIHNPKVFGIMVTSECTSAIVTLGILVVTAVLLVATRVRIRRLVVAALVAAAAFFALNIARLVGIALATKQWGLGAGFHWSHVWAGTFVTVFGGVGVCVLYMVLLGVRSGRKAVR